MDKLPKKFYKTVISFWLVCVLCIACGYYFFWYPLKEKIKDYEITISQKENIYELAKFANLQQTKESVASKLSEINQNIDKFSIESDLTSQLTFDISTMAKELYFDDFSNQGTSAEEYEKVVNNIYFGTYEMSFTAGFNQFAYFINKLERHNPVLFVEEFNLKAPSAKNSKDNVKISLDFIARVD